MGIFKYRNADIRQFIEITTSSEITNAGVLSYTIRPKSVSGYLTSASEHTATYPTGQEYATAALSGKIKINGTAVQLAKIGYRPTFKTLLVTAGAGTHYLNWFANGEVWLSTVQNSASGTQLSTTAQRRRVFIISMFGAGGGGGSSKWGVFKNNAGAGGGGGGMMSQLFYITSDSGSMKFVVGSGGTCGKDGGGGSAGGRTYFTGSGVTIGPRGGSGGAGNAGSGGKGGSFGDEDDTGLSDTVNGFYFLNLNISNGTSGGGVGTTSRPTSAVNYTRPMPEATSNDFQASPGYSNDGRTGSGNATGAGGCGYAGKGGGSSGDAQDGKAGSTSGGGSGGGCHAATNRWGGNGGNGCIKIYV